MIGVELDGRYRVIERLGSGGMGVVYRAEHLLIRRQFAVKVMSQSAYLDAHLLDRFRREAMAAASIGHPNIVDVTDMGTTHGDVSFLVLEYLDGLDLARAVAKEGRFTVPRAVHVARQLCEALSAVHDKRIVHRDLKPENIMLVERAGDPNFVKVLDFGICKLLSDDYGSAGLTGSQTSLGTPQYMAPEQFRGSARVDQRADLHAVGAVLFFMLTGQPPYEADDLPRLLLRICTEAPPSARMIVPHIPLALDELIKRACAKRPEDRFGDARELARALAPFSHDGPPSLATLRERGDDVRPTATSNSHAPTLLAPDSAPDSPFEAARPTSVRRLGRRWAAALLLATLSLLGLQLARRDRPAHAVVPPPYPAEADAGIPERLCLGEPGACDGQPLPTGQAVPARDEPITRRPPSRSRKAGPTETSLRTTTPTSIARDQDPSGEPSPPVATPPPEAAGDAPLSTDELAPYRRPQRQLRDVR